MAVYAIGDVQGCFDPLHALLRRIAFDRAKDTLWFAGDLVNRGPQSLEVLRFVKSLGDRAVVVLGNHDLHLLAIAAGVTGIRPRDTFQSVLSAPDREELLDWLRTRPLLYHDPLLDYTLVHAGLLPQWTLSDAKRLASEVEHVLSEQPDEFFPRMYGDTPDSWQEDLTPPDRWRVIVNAFTRLRYLDREGNIYLKHKESPSSKTSHLSPWFDIPGRKALDTKIIFGHWSVLSFCQGKKVISIDSGCGWGGSLTAARIDLEPVEFYSVPGPVMQLAN